MRNFTVQLIAAAAFTTTAWAQLPRECFFVTEMHGYGDDDFTDLLSDLPTLMSMYKPGMRLKSITSMQDPDEDNRLTGLQVDLINEKGKTLQLPMVGAQLDEWASQKVHFKMQQPDKISILTDKELAGVCDVVIYQGTKITSLSKDPRNCLPEEEGIEETWLSLPEDTPLVGFHGKSDGEVLNSLGLILLNKTDPVCQKPLSKGQFQVYQGSIFDQSEQAEGAITEQEREKAAALEAILAYDSIQKARMSKQQLKEEIARLNGIKQAQDEAGDEPMSSDDLKEMLDQMASFDIERNPRTKEGLKNFFDRLIEHYDRIDDETPDDLEYTLPIKVSELRYLYSELALRDGTAIDYFDDRELTESATIDDMLELFDELAYHFELGTEGDLDLNLEETKALADIFGRLELFYAFDAPEEVPDKEDLWPIYDQLAETFGQASDYSVSEKKAQDLYQKIMNKENINRTFEGNKVESFEDLKKIQEQQTSAYLTKLEAKLQKFQSIEDEQIGYLEEQMDAEEQDLESILSTLKNDQRRFDQIQRTLIELERRGQKQDQKQNMTPGKTVNPSEGMAPPAFLKDSNEATLKKLTQAMEELPQLASIVQNEQQQVTEVDEKLDEKAEKIIYSFIGVLAVAIGLGMALGGCLLLCCLKCYQRGQQKRLTQANRMNLRFTEGDDNQIDMRTMPADQVDRDEERPRLNKVDSLQPMTEQKLQSQKSDVDEVAAAEEIKVQKDQPPRLHNLAAPVTTNDMRTQNDEDENDFVNVLTTRGLTYDQPKERRTTFRRQSETTPGGQDEIKMKSAEV